MTNNDIIQLARQHLNDTKTELQRYTDDALYRALNAALMRARRLRPDLFVGTLRNTMPNYTSADSATTPPLPDYYHEVLAEAVAGYAEATDDEFTTDGRVGLFLTRFDAALLQ